MAAKSIKEKYNLPDSIKVKMHKGKSGEYYVTLPDYPGCLTIAKSFGELIENVTDALLTYFEVPRNEAKKADFIYLPRVPRITAFTIKPKKGKHFIKSLKEFRLIPQQYFYA